MNIFSVVGIAVLSALGVLLLRSCSAECAQLLPVCAVAILLILVLPQIADLLQSINDLGQRSGMEDASLSVVLRGVGILLLTRFSAGICYDCGQKTLGETVEYCGRIAVVSLALPMVLSLAEQFSDLGV